MNDVLAALAEWLYRHRGKVIGTLLGLLLGWMIIAYGVFKTLFIALCLVGGYIVGTWIDEGPPGRKGGLGWSRRRRL